MLKTRHTAFGGWVYPSEMQTLLSNTVAPVALRFSQSLVVEGTNHHELAPEVHGSLYMVESHKPMFTALAMKQVYVKYVIIVVSIN